MLHMHGNSRLASLERNVTAYTSMVMFSCTSLKHIRTAGASRNEGQMDRLFSLRSELSDVPGANLLCSNAPREHLTTSKLGVVRVLAGHPLSLF